MIFIDTFPSDDPRTHINSIIWTQFVGSGVNETENRSFYNKGIDLTQ